MNDKKIIGFDRKIRLDWLDATADLIRRGISPADSWMQIDNSLVDILSAKQARRKTKTVLFHIWVYIPDNLRSLRDRGIALLCNQSENIRLAIHWGMCMARYPFFRDLSIITGRLLNVQESVTMSQITHRMVESWGDRSTLIRSVQRVIRCFVDWGVLKENAKKGAYIPDPKIFLDDKKEISVWLLESYICGSENNSIPFRQITGSPVFFPFSLRLSLNDLKSNPHLEIFRHGLDEDIVSLNTVLKGEKKKSEKNKF